MKHTLLTIGLSTLLATQAHAWGLSEIGGKLLQKGVETTVNSTVSGNDGKTTLQQTAGAVQQEALNQAQQSANSQATQPDPTTLEGAATNIAASTATQATTDALNKSGIPGAGVAGSVAGGLVKGFSGMFKKKPAEEPATAQPQQ